MRMYELLTTGIAAGVMLFLVWIALELLYNVLFQPFPHRPYVFLSIKRLLTGGNDA